MNLPSVVGMAAALNQFQAGSVPHLYTAIQTDGVKEALQYSNELLKPQQSEILESTQMDVVLLD